MSVVIAPDRPDAPDVLALIAAHRGFALTHSPVEEVYALDVSGLLVPEVAFFTAREDGRLLGMGALRDLEAGHVEIKSMNVMEAARGRGIGRLVLEHLLGVARERRCARVSLETGTMDAFAPARALYASAGFTRCPPFGDYQESPNSVCLTLAL